VLVFLLVLVLACRVRSGARGLFAYEHELDIEHEAEHENDHGESISIWSQAARRTRRRTRERANRGRTISRYPKSLLPFIRSQFIAGLVRARAAPGKRVRGSTGRAVRRAHRGSSES